MKRLVLAIVALMLLAAAARAQSGFTQAHAVVLDPTGVPYANCSGNASFVPSPSATTFPTIGGSTFPTTAVIASCDSFGAFSLKLADNNVVVDGHTSPPASQWRFNINAQGGTPGFQCTMTITGPSQDISSQLQACAAPLPATGGGNVFDFVTTQQSATPAFIGKNDTVFAFVLNQNVLSSTFNVTPPANKSPVWYVNPCQDAVGGRSMNWPSNVTLPTNYVFDTAANHCSPVALVYNPNTAKWTPWLNLNASGSGGGGTCTPAGSPNAIQINAGGGACGAGPVVSTVAIKPGVPNDPIQYVSANGNDANDGLSWGSAKLTVYAAVQALPGGSAGVVGTGTVITSGTFNYGGPASNQGMWIMGGIDPNFASPPIGWLKKTSTSAPVNIECAFAPVQLAHSHTPACVMQGGGTSDLVHPALWLSGTGSINLRNIAFSNFLNTYVKIGIDSNNNRTGTGGSSSISLDGIAWIHGNCRFGGGPGIDIGSNTFWVWLRNIDGSGCPFGELTIATPGSLGLSRLSNVVTVNTTTANSIVAGANNWITITNATDPSFNGSFVVQSTSSNTQFTYNQIGPNATSGNGQVVTSAKAAINLDPGSGSGSGLIFLSDFQTNSGGIRIVPGSGGAGMYIRNGDYEGDFSNPDMPEVLITSSIVPMNVVIENVEVSDAITPIPGVQIDNTANPVIKVSRVDAGVKGPALILGGTPADPIISDLRAGHIGFDNFGRINAGGIDVARRGFSPVVAPAQNIANTNPSAWIYEVGSGTITSGIAAPDGTIGAGRATSNSGVSFIDFYSAPNTSLTVGDAYIFGVWERSNSGGALSGLGVKVTLNSNGLGTGDTCVGGVGGAASATGLFSRLAGDGQWIWNSGICKVATNQSLAGLAMSAQITNPNVMDFYAPTLIKIPVGTKSDNELYEIAANLEPFPSTASTSEVSMLPGQRLRIGTTLFAGLGTPNDGASIFCTDCVAVSNPCVGTGTGSFAQRIAGAWVCGGGGGGGGGTPGGSTNALQYNGGGSSFAGFNAPVLAGNYLCGYTTPTNAAVAPTCPLPGIPVNQQVGTTYTIGAANYWHDRATLITATNSAAQTYTAVNPSTAGFGFNMPYALWNTGTASGLLTENASGFTINGNASLSIPINWLAHHWSDGVNLFAAVVPTAAAFPPCLDTGGNHFNRDANGNIICGTSASGNGLSGMTAGQVPIAATATSVTSSEALAGAGAAITTGPASSTSGDVTQFTGTGGQISDAGFLASNVVRKDAAATLGAFLYNFAASTLTFPSAAGATASATNTCTLDTTNKNIHCFINSADAIVPGFVTAPTTGNCVKSLVSSGNVLLADGGGLTCGIQNTTTTNPTTAVGGNACSASATTVTMTGVTSAMIPLFGASSDITASTGWGSTGGLVIVAWFTTNTLNYKICNQTSSSITPGAVTWNVGAR